ncbi:hypothetical protein IJI55_01325 [Candidatus Saccharibacteria bacterium]|nr:hypothetical protein [Candidatus Saccharibacteria bacterium]
MGKYTKKIIARLMAAMLIIATMTTFASPPPVVRAAEKYFADVDTSDPLFTKAVDFCNKRGAFGKKRGTEYYLHPDATASKGKFIWLVYGMYHKSLGWGDKDYAKKEKKSWRWAQSHGFVKRNEDKSTAVTFGWEYEIFDKIIHIVYGGHYYDELSKGSKLTLNNRSAVSTLGSFAMDFCDPKEIE